MPHRFAFAAALVLAPFAARAEFLTECVVPTAAVPGAALVLTGDARVQAKWCDSPTGYTSDAYLATPDYVYLATGHVTPAGSVVDLGAHSNGDELVFSIYVRNTGLTYYSGDGSRNPDGVVHAAIQELGDGEYMVGFEDLFGGGDRDYNDLFFAVRVEPLNAAPVAEDGSEETDEDTAVTFELVATDAEGDTLSYGVATGPAHGTLALAGSQATYTPDANYNGPDSFTFTASDAAHDSNVATVNLTVNPVNDRPTTADLALSVAEDGTVSFVLEGHDVDGDDLTFALTMEAAHGAFTGAAPELSYSPAGDYSGSDSFAFTVSDGALTSTEEVVTITVLPANDAPVATGDTMTASEDVALTFDLKGTDADGEDLTYVLVSQPDKGTVEVVSGARVTFTPAPNAFGDTTFTFKATDPGGASSNVAEVVLRLQAVNDAPVAVSGPPREATEDAPATFTLDASDLDPGETESLTYELVTQPEKGSVEVVAGSGVTFTPHVDANGSTSFTFRAVDVHGGVSNPATVTIDIAAVNDTPVATALVRTVVQGETALTLAGSDVDGDELTFALDQQPEHGTLAGAPPALTYTSAPDVRGEVRFTFTVSDGQATSAPATVTLTVTNGAPVAAANASTLRPVEGEGVSFTATGEDPAGDTLTFTWDFGDGTATAEGAAVEHAFADEGACTVTVTVSDGVDAVQKTIEIEVLNGAPIVVPLAAVAAAEEAKELTFTAAASDPGTGDALTYAWDFGDGSATLTGQTVTHTYADDGAFTVTVSVTDDAGAVTAASRAVDVANVPPVPTAVAPQTVKAGGKVSLTLAATDPAGALDPLSWSLVEGPGALTAEGVYTWEAPATAQGELVVTARVSDDEGGGSELVFRLSLEALEEAGGCACTSSPVDASGAVLLLLALSRNVRRRRVR